jgi:hypothetical protein
LCSALKWGDEFERVVEHLLWLHVRLYPHNNLQQHTIKLHEAGALVSKAHVARIFRNWRWSWKRPCVQHIRKYTPANIRAYTHWVAVVPQLPMRRLKFVDESHFVSRQLHRNRAVGPVGASVYLRDGRDLAESYSTTLLLDLTNEDNPFFFDVRAESNNEWDFYRFVLSAVDAGRLTTGDFLIVDNASVHWGGETWPLLDTLFRELDIEYVFLPTYSPELNPCELVFAQIKNYIRSNRTPDMQVHQLMLAAMSNISYSTVVSYYDMCINIQDRLRTD